jgi:DNA invertase Pin-like site-specific DNA recombinase
LHALAKREGLHIAETITEAKSAKAPYARTGFEQLTNLIEKGKVNGILCWKLDRLSRNPIDSGKIQWLLQSGKINCIYTSDRKCWPDDNALLFAVEQGMANQFLIDLSKNVKRGLYSKAEKGFFPGVPPLGYINSKKREKGKEEIFVDKERFALVRKMWDLLLSGNYTQRQILRIATNEWKLDTPKRGKKGKQAPVRSSIYKIFANIFYTGYFHYSGKLYKGNHKPMITLEEFDAAQILIGNKALPRPGVHSFPFTGIMKCAHCGASITATEKKKLVKSTGEIKSYVYYHCTRRISEDCHAPPITLKNLEAQIEKFLCENTIDSDFYNLGMAVIASNEENRNSDYKAVSTKQQTHVAELERKMSKLLGYLLNETITEEEYGLQKKELEERINLEKAKLKQMTAHSERYTQQIKNAFHFCYAALYALKEGTMQTRKDVLAHIGSNQRLMEKNLYVDVFGWLSAIKRGEQKLLTEKTRFELKWANENKADSANDEIFLLVCGVVDEVRTEFAKITNPTVPDFSGWVKKL